ncbi:PspC domain-containing protein [Secundilactobacillus collinoides]|uniref:Phage shock protein PspC N-terminal domain-containing protein n=1 Tax=Secundilactobacillus collinoides DSM 20515 = JCM 1123 TaxID=1423733 RepID=A0A0R2B9A8_SECCO|nr:PspC domain-containing protein [Secundilactobacillus collinoides]KRM75413.1 hypothetical protein FC82_GL002284 [Secundilactobacillus collinoides DSM 20515 = JCM 1123]
MSQRRRLTRSSNKIISGVLGGIAEYFGFSATILRVVFVILTIYPGHILFGLLVYLLLMTLIPRDTDHHGSNQPHNPFSGFGGGSGKQPRKTLHDVSEEDSDER